MPKTLIGAQLMQKSSIHSAFKAGAPHTHTAHLSNISARVSVKVIISSYFQHWLLH